MLEIKNLKKVYSNGKVAVDALNLHVEAGDIYGFIGHNGAGKTTTLNACAQILDFEEGEIIISGMSVKDKPMECKSIVAYLPDNPVLYEYMTGTEFINFVADIYSVSTEERTKLTKTLSEAFDISANLNQQISSYSHGMKQKLAIISALVHNPKLLLLDEPFVGLDPKSTHAFKELMHVFCKNGGAVLLSTHVLEVAQSLCNKIAIIKQGKLIKSGPTKAIIKDESLEDVFMEIYNEK